MHNYRVIWFKNRGLWFKKVCRMNTDLGTGCRDKSSLHWKNSAVLTTVCELTRRTGRISLFLMKFLSLIHCSSTTTWRAKFIPLECRRLPQVLWVWICCFLIFLSGDWMLLGVSSFLDKLHDLFLASRITYAVCKNSALFCCL